MLLRAIGVPANPASYITTLTRPGEGEEKTRIYSMYSESAKPLTSSVVCIYIPFAVFLLSCFVACLLAYVLRPQSAGQQSQPAPISFRHNYETRNETETFLGQPKPKRIKLAQQPKPKRNRFISMSFLRNRNRNSVENNRCDTNQFLS